MLPTISKTVETINGSMARCLSDQQPNTMEASSRPSEYAEVTQPR